MRNPVIVIFGAPDHEEKAARALCKTANVWTATATTGTGFARVHAGNAYQADGFSLDGNYFSNDDVPSLDVILFECGDGAAPKWGDVIARCDHHREGDFGYDLPPYRFWQASSIGQLASHLGYGYDAGKAANAMKVDEKWLLMVAAGDHCPAAAYRGDCFGIDPAEFKSFRLSQMATVTQEGCEGWCNVCGFTGAWAQHSNIGEIKKQMAFAEACLSAAPDTKWAGVKDLRHWGQIPMLPEAALSTGKAYLSQIPETDRDGNSTGKIKIVLGGDNTPETVTAVMEWMSLFGKPYGVPSRGFAGVVTEPSSMLEGNVSKAMYSIRYSLDAGEAALQELSRMSKYCIQ